MEISEHEKQWLTNQGAEMLATLGVKKHNSVIDFGCGKGRYTIPLSQVVGENGNVLAVEHNSDEVAVLCERVALFGRQGSIRILNSKDVRLPSVDDGTIDSVFAFDVLQHVENWEIFFKSVCRVLRPCGSINVYPAVIPHPGVVDIELLVSTMNKVGLQNCSRRCFTMMHDKDMVNDEVYTFSLSN